ncbi:zinc-dependent metalloprotease [Halorubrum sp. DTA98]|uniref:zinc-dependent metalloprotease n=1 Tax=Halorubrum sp. DTA98 TaxID=3402163 RepID=UPI003AACE0EC
MNVLRGLRAVSEASGAGVVDWENAAEAAKASTDPGSLALSPAEREGYAADVRDARSRLRSVAGIEFEVPETVEIQNRHHWIDASLSTFENVMRPIEAVATPVLPDLSRVVNTGSMAVTLGFLARNVLGQYDPLLLANEPDADHGLYFVHPNIVAVAAELDADYPRFRRWIAFHEVAHAAEFGVAPWLPTYLESRVEEGVETLTAGRFDREAFVELQLAMTAVEGYAELLMDRAFDDEYADLRRKVDARRDGGGPFQRVMRRFLGLDLKRRQYERGAAFFEAVADARGLDGASVVWERPEYLPTSTELDRPETWLARVDP